MGFEVSAQTKFNAEKIMKEPLMILEIDGVVTRFGTGPILERIRYGDAELIYGGGEVYGGFRKIDNQEDLISFDGGSGGGTTTSINQQLRPDKGKGTSVTSMDVSIVDKNNIMSELISPGVVVDDLLAKKARIYLMLGPGVSFPEDALLVFRGIISEIKTAPGIVTLTVSHPEQKKRVSAFTTIETELSSGIGTGDTTIPVDSVANILSKVAGPDGSFDPAFESYVRINDEIIKFDGTSGSDLINAVRGQFGTTAATHSSGDSVTTMYRLQDDAMQLALKLMMSGVGGAWQTGVEIANFNFIDGIIDPTNTILFRGVDVKSLYGISVGDYITTTGATNGANNVSAKTISGIFTVEDNSYIQVDGVSFVLEIDSAATVSFRSAYDTLPDGAGMGGDEVDVDTFIEKRRLFLSNFLYDFRLDDTIENIKEFIEDEVFKPAGAFSVPRNAKSSVGFHIGPIPGTETKILNDKNIVSASRISINRSLNQNFFNTIIYKFDPDVIETDKFTQGNVTISNDSLTRIKIGNKPLVIESKGMRKALQGQTLANQIAGRRLDRYKFGAESFNRLNVLFGVGFTMEIGDILILDGTNLKMTDTKTGDRERKPALYEVVNKKMNFKTGEIFLDLVNTAFDLDARYGLISPCSEISAGATTSTITIRETGNSVFGANEYLKWADFSNFEVVVRSPDSVTRKATSTINLVTGNTINLNPALPFTPQEGDFLELGLYDTTSDQLKLLYAFMQDNATFADGEIQYQML